MTWTFHFGPVLLGTDQAGIEDVKDAADFGRGAPADREHYAYLQANVDRQVWIQRGKQALPCKMVITNHGGALQPQ